MYIAICFMNWYVKLTQEIEPQQLNSPFQGFWHSVCKYAMCVGI